MFEKVRAITIVRRMILDSETVVNEAKEEGFLISNYYANAECAMLALAVVFSNIYTKKEKLGNAIVKEAISGSWRQFFSEKHKQEYRDNIEKLSAQYTEIIQFTFNKTDLNEVQKLNTAYCEICKIFANYLFAEHTTESEDYFMLVLISVKEYVAAITGQKQEKQS